MAKSRINKPNFTQIPNVIFDEMMSDLGNAEFRVLMAICRKTFGWGRAKDRVSLTQIGEMTGLSRQSVIDGISGLVGRGLVEKSTSKLGNSYVVVVNEIDYQNEEVVKQVDRSSRPTRPELVKQGDTQKKYLNKLTKEILSPVGDQAQTPAVVTGKTKAESLHHQTIDFISRVHHKVHGCPVVIDPKEAAHVRQLIKFAETEDPENPKAVIERRLRVCLHKMETATTDYWADFKFTPSKIRSRWNELSADLPKVTAAEKAIRENELRINDVPAAEAVDSIEEKNRRELLAMFAEAENNVSA